MSVLEQGTMMASLECPRLRPGLEAVQDDSDPHHIYICDRLRLCDRPQRLSWREFDWVRLFDGRRTLREIQFAAMRELGGQLIVLDFIRSLVERLDAALLLDSPRFWERFNSPVREPSCVGCYEGEPTALRRQLTGLFTHSKGPGLPRETQADGQLRAALIPHIDYQRGGVSYAWGFKEVFERSNASLFVIIGTSHYCSARYTLTRKDFKTPLGIVHTDQGYIDRLVQHYGDGLFTEEWAHLPEHSIELEVVFLQYWYEQRRPIRIVPLLVGTFQDAVMDGTPPHEREDVARMIMALRQTEAEVAEQICYIISGDLAHIGPKFGDPEPVGASALRQSREQDQAILRQTESADPEGYFGLIADEMDSRRICGLPPTYTLLKAMKPQRGQVLHYDQYVHPRGFESVSFASVAFYR
jgi:AmmeMemoRadiSam system protein B